MSTPELTPPVHATMGSLARRQALAEMAVVIPARNEEEMLPGCLAALALARTEFQRRYPHVPVRVLTVLDSCTDATAQVAAEAGAEVLAVSEGNVGAARAAGCQAVISTARTDLSRLWIAMTDADTTVPPNWLISQYALANVGVDALVGTVEPDDEFTGSHREAWFDLHDLREGHEHVHGANLGLRASVYQEVGGFQPMAAHEDVDLVTRLREHTCRVLATDEHRVVTSSRETSRAEEGFSDFLNRLRKEVS